MLELQDRYLTPILDRLELYLKGEYFTGLQKYKGLNRSGFLENTAKANVHDEQAPLRKLRQRAEEAVSALSLVGDNILRLTLLAGL